MKPQELVAVRTLRSVPDAEVAQGVLEAAGIESTIRSDNAGGMFPAVDAARLFVRAEDADRADAALREAERHLADTPPR